MSAAAKEILGHPVFYLLLTFLLATLGSYFGGWLLFRDLMSDMRADTLRIRKILKELER